MQKKRIIQIILLIIVAIAFYSLPIITFVFMADIENDNRQFEIKENTIDIENGTMTISNMNSFYSEDDETYYVVGYLKNETDTTYESVILNYRFYDENGIVLGEEETYVMTLNQQSTWKFKVLFQDIDADEVKSYELTSVRYDR